MPNVKVRENEPFEVMATPNDAWDVDGYKRLEDAGVSHILTCPGRFITGSQTSSSIKWMASGATQTT